MQRETGNQGQQDISHGARREDVSQIGEGERRHVRRKKAEQKENAERYPGIGDGKKKLREMRKRDVPDLLHPVGEQRIADGREHADPSQYQILAKGHKTLNLDRFLRLRSGSFRFPIHLIFVFIFEHLVPHGAHFQERSCFFVEPLALSRIECGLA